MTAQAVLRAAAAKVRIGWSKGASARDRYGSVVTLYVNGSSETGRTSPNPAAGWFSAYGAIVMAQYELRATLGPADWDMVFTRAREATGAVHGGTNYVHPLIQFNESEGRTAEEVAELLEACADELDAGVKVDPPIRLPVELPAGEGVMLVPPVVRGDGSSL